MKHYKYFLFDWDGTLARTLDTWLDSLRQSLEKHGHYLNDSEIGANYEAFKQRFEAQGFEDVDQIVTEALSIAGMKTPSVDLYPQAIEVLKYLHNNHKKLALVTTSVHAQIDPLLIKHDMVKLFDAVICGDETVHLKPHPEPILKVIAALGGKPEEALMIGDSTNDIRAAESAGVDSMLFYPPSHDKFHVIQELKLLNPTYIIHDLKEVMQLIKKH